MYSANVTNTILFDLKLEEQTDGTKIMNTESEVIVMFGSQSDDHTVFLPNESPSSLLCFLLTHTGGGGSDNGGVLSVYTVVRVGE